MFRFCGCRLRPRHGIVTIAPTNRILSGPNIYAVFFLRPTIRACWAGSAGTRSRGSSAAAAWESCSRGLDAAAATAYVAIKVLAPHLAASAAARAAVRPRGPGRRGRRPRTRRRHPRRRRGQRACPTWSCSTSPGESLQKRLDRARAAGPRGDPADRHADRRRAGRGPRPGAGPSRHQAGEHPAGERRRAGQDHRFRPGPGRRRRQPDAQRRRSPARRSTCRRSRPAARRSTTAATCSAWAACCTRCAPAGRRSGLKRAMAVLRRVCDDAPRPIRELNPDIPDWLATTIEKLHAKDPSGRFQSAEEVSQLFEQCLAHVQQPTVIALPELLRLPVAAPTVPRDGRHWKRWLAGISAALVLIVASVLALRERPRIKRIPIQKGQLLRSPRAATGRQQQIPARLSRAGTTARTRESPKLRMRLRNLITASTRIGIIQRNVTDRENAQAVIPQISIKPRKGRKSIARAQPLDLGSRKTKARAGDTWTHEISRAARTFASPWGNARNAQRGLRPQPNQNYSHGWQSNTTDEFPSGRENCPSEWTSLSVLLTDNAFSSG